MVRFPKGSARVPPGSARAGGGLTRVRFHESFAKVLRSGSPKITRFNVRFHEAPGFYQVLQGWFEAIPRVPPGSARATG